MRPLGCRIGGAALNHAAHAFVARDFPADRDGAICERFVEQPRPENYAFRSRGAGSDTKLEWVDLELRRLRGNKWRGKRDEQRPAHRLQRNASGYFSAYSQHGASRFVLG